MNIPDYIQRESGSSCVNGTPISGIADTFVHEQRATEGLSIANHNGSASCLALKADVHVKRHWGRNLSRNCLREMRYTRLGRSILGLVKAAIDQSLGMAGKIEIIKTSFMDLTNFASDNAGTGDMKGRLDRDVGALHLVGWSLTQNA
ncbi:hypothetical protein ACI3LX_004790 [Candidozyma auris]